MLHRNRLSKKLLISILLVSAFVTTFLTAISFYLDYRRELDSFNSIVEEIEIRGRRGNASEFIKSMKYRFSNN